MRGTDVHNELMRGTDVHNELMKGTDVHNELMRGTIIRKVNSKEGEKHEQASETTTL